MRTWVAEYPNGRRLIEADDVDEADTLAWRRWGTPATAVYPLVEPLSGEGETDGA